MLISEIFSSATHVLSRWLTAPDIRSVQRRALGSIQLYLLFFPLWTCCCLSTLAFWAPSQALILFWITRGISGLNPAFQSVLESLKGFLVWKWQSSILMLDGGCSCLSCETSWKIIVHFSSTFPWLFSSADYKVLRCLFKGKFNESPVWNFKGEQWFVFFHQHLLTIQLANCL